MNLRKSLLFLLAISMVSTVCIVFINQGASFNKYAPKLLKFEGQGYGIHKPIWGKKMFTKEEALYIHRHYYWDRYLGSAFKSQEVAEVLIDHLINAGEGINRRNIKAFEEIIGVNADGTLSVKDIETANQFEYPEDIVNPYVDYRLRYYRTRKNAKIYKGWFKRAKSFYMKETQRDNKEEETAEQKDNIIEDYIVLPKTKAKPTTPKKEEEYNIVEDIF